ncbi:MAG: dihydrofolate reductase [Porticoccaceae bacterium]|jgi:dihydrofolate reductase|nr:dihydrofolate reductase [Porticoccaceae bacterium]MBT4213091.1 dihydrofolate reductase [Porticoccaceae bacterium]MBT6780308.1 dihydrofolate reductase [Porticoccaceae bacterium]MBT7946588.1 dihydrofolate reductase [Porticoccaceae bacterium]
MKISLIVAVSRNGAIGLNNQLPWYLPEDLKYFKSVTMGKPLIMGRKTFDSIGRPLPGRANIVLTRDPQWTSDGVKVVQSVEQALVAGEIACEAADVDEIMVIGGEQIYRMTIDLADRIYLTQVDTDVEGDAFFPDIDLNNWSQTRVKLPEIIDKHPYRFLVLDRD